MSKALLVIEMPENCLECPFFLQEDIQCSHVKWPAKTRRHMGCPLKPMPLMKTTMEGFHDRETAVDGWNACVEALGGDEEYEPTTEEDDGEEDDDEV